MTIKRTDVNMDTLKNQGYKAAYVPDDDTLEYCRDQFTIDEMTRRYVEACHDGTPIRFVDRTIGNVRYRLTQPTRGWFIRTLWFAKELHSKAVRHDAKKNGDGQPQAEKVMYPMRDAFDGRDPVTRQGLMREFAR